MGRPSLYTEALAEAFCERVASGKTLDEIVGEGRFVLEDMGYEST